MSSINVGEVLYIETRAAGPAAAASAVEALGRRVDVRDADRELVFEAARIKAGHRVSYADAFAVALAERERAPLLTGDTEIAALRRPTLTLRDPRGHGD
jgi:ribonuclease VapC